MIFCNLLNKAANNPPSASVLPFKSERVKKAGWEII